MKCSLRQCLLLERLCDYLLIYALWSSGSEADTVLQLDISEFLCLAFT